MQVIAGPTLLNDKDEVISLPAVITITTGMKLRDHVNIKFSEFEEQPVHYRAATVGFSIRGTREFVYVLFELQFKGDNKRRFYRLTIGAFQQCFDEFMAPQTGLTAFSCVVSKDEYCANLRAQRIADYLINNDQYSVDLNNLALQMYSVLVQPDLEQMCKRKFWRQRRAHL